MTYVTDEYLDKLHGLLEKDGINVDRNEFPSVDEIELGLEREFDSGLFYAIEENNEDRTMHLGEWALEDGSYEGLVKSLLKIVDKSFGGFATTSEYNDGSGTERVTVDTGKKQYEWTFDHSYLDDQQLVKSVASVTNEISKNRLVLVLDEDSTFVMSLPLDSANYLDGKFDVIEVCK
ncbi:hypothetical protein EDC56_3707 [Sinobacterium caligoides]|uniref:Uncharacterized protein n=1 Tax=Sinobacterium caligoides TaxID=933926 RepID=A0A3N2D5Y2_9GAMM|nr:hypothetical protein [Sinobacterium caligoides]ROR94894.1 hypothetical protein EDC56_3707 [Sinobacterium caligoides]